MKILLLIGSLLLAFLQIVTALIMSIGFVLLVIPVSIIRHTLGFRRSFPNEMEQSQ